MGYIRLLVSAVILVLVIGFLSAGSTSVYRSPVVYDISWPNCGKQVAIRTERGIVGVLGGLNFHKNPCLAQEAGAFGKADAYVNTGYPGRDKALKYGSYPKKCAPSDENCLAYDYGYAAADFAVKQATLAGLMPANWWLDVETENSWSDNTSINRSALNGGYDRLRRVASSGLVGFYSYPGQWKLLTGDWHNGRPVWSATGSRDYETAFQACQEPSFSGGRVLLAQYTPKLDQNLICDQSYR